MKELKTEDTLYDDLNALKDYEIERFEMHVTDLLIQILSVTEQALASDPDVSPSTERQILKYIESQKNIDWKQTLSSNDFIYK